MEYFGKVEIFMKVKFRITACFLIIAVLFLSSCSDKKSSVPENDYSAIVPFSEIFYEFNEIKQVADELSNSSVDENWWLTFDEISDNVAAAYLANLNIVNSPELDDIDTVLNQALVGILDEYKNAFEIMEAAKGNSDEEILRYAFNDFTNRIIYADDKWDQTILLITATENTDNSISSANPENVANPENTANSVN